MDPRTATCGPTAPRCRLAISLGICSIGYTRRDLHRLEDLYSSSHACIRVNPCGVEVGNSTEAPDHRVTRALSARRPCVLWPRLIRSPHCISALDATTCCHQTSPVQVHLSICSCSVAFLLSGRLDREPISAGLLTAFSSTYHTLPFPDRPLALLLRSSVSHSSTLDGISVSALIQPFPR